MLRLSEPETMPADVAGIVLSLEGYRSDSLIGVTDLGIEFQLPTGEKDIITWQGLKHSSYLYLADLGYNLPLWFDIDDPDNGMPANLFTQ